jgi:hypothetical protein
MQSVEPQLPPLGTESRSGGRSIAARIVGSLFFLVFFAMGTLFEVLVVREFLREMATYRWHSTAATVESSGVEQTDDDERPYRLAVAYRYSYQGVEYASDRVTIGAQASASFDTVQRKAIRLARGTTVTCYVDPDRPEQAVLERRNPAFGFLMLFPLIFVAVGAVGLYAMWKPSSPTPETVAISAKASAARLAHVLPIALGLLFVAVGGSLFVAIGVIPGIRLLRATSWLETPCTIVSSTVRSHATDDGTTYRVDILFRYEIDGVAYRSNRHDFVNFSSSGFESKREIVDRYPEGSESVCFVDPEDPTRAVLVREFRPAYLVGLFPLLFLVAGAAVTRWGLRQRFRASRRRSTTLPIGAEPGLTDGPIALRPRQSPGAKILGALIFALIWNGILSVFLVDFVGNWQRGQHAWGLALFLTPFVIVGVGSFVMVSYFVLAAFNPRPRLKLDPASPGLGDSVVVEWRLDGRSSRIEHLHIALEGREEATYQRGTDTRTDREVFARIVVTDARYGPEISQGSTFVQIPHDTMHSFAGTHNRVAWIVKLHGEISRWPDVVEEFEITVQPRPVEDFAR